MDYGNIKANSTNSVTSNYKYFIANESANSITLLATSSGYVNNDLSKGLSITKILNSHFTNGRSYDIKIALNLKAYMINFDLNATDAKAGKTISQTKGWGTDITLKTTANPTRKGYVFVGWTLDTTKTAATDIISSGASVSDAILNRTTYSSGSVILYAVWAKKYDITFYAQSKTNAYSKCPTKTEVFQYIGAGMYWDSTTPWADMSGNIYRGGVWLMRKTKIPSGTTSPTGIGTVASGKPSNTDNYFFLPAAWGATIGTKCGYWLKDGSSLTVTSSNSIWTGQSLNTSKSLNIWSAQ
jgi:uncharacterized repeat protein (TIGR02543 family)